MLLVSISVGCDMAVVPGGGTAQGNGDSIGGGDTGQGGNSSQITGPRIIAPAFINRGGIGVGGISTFPLGESLSGEQSPGMFLDGKPSCLTTVDGQARLGINSAGELLAFARFAGNCDDPESYFVNVYADATQLDGVQQPVRTAILEDPLDGFGEFLQVAIDRERDLMYVSSTPPERGPGPDRIYVYEGTSDPSFDGVVPPVRTIILPDITNVFALELGTDDTLYVLGGGVSRITDASTRDGELTNDDIATLSLGLIQDIAVDSQNRLWLLRENPQTGFDPFTGNILRVDEDFVDTDVNVLISYAGFPKSIQIDTQGTVYMHVSTSGDIKIFEDIESGSATEETTPTRTATGMRFESKSRFIIVE